MTEKTAEGTKKILSLMEQLLHFTWMHRIFPAPTLRAASGETIEVVDTGLHNHNSGPDFFNAKVRIDGMLWVGNVEIHDAASDWFRHGHERDEAYDNVVLHIVGEIDAEAVTRSGRKMPQVVVPVPQGIRDNLSALLAEEKYPPCWRAIPSVAEADVAVWLERLVQLRLEEQEARIATRLQNATGSWEQAAFITLARCFGFGINSDAFEEWAEHVPLRAVGRHRDDLGLVEAFFFGQAGLLDENLVPPERRDAHYVRLATDYRYLAHKFGLTPMNGRHWRFLRLRPHNFPHIRLSQFAAAYHAGGINFSELSNPNATIRELRRRFAVGATEYWQSHYNFGLEMEKSDRILQAGSRNLLIINAVAPILYAYGRYVGDEKRILQAREIWRELPAEKNYITRSWEQAGIVPECAAHSQALHYLHCRYCEPRDCIRCRFGYTFLKMKGRHKIG